MGSKHQEIVETRIDVADLELGMHVVRLDRPWEETDFLLQGFVIRDRSELHALRSQCQTVFIEGRASHTETFNTPPGHTNGKDKKPSKGLFGLFRRNNKEQTEQPAAKVQQKPKKRVNYINQIDTSREMSNAVMKFEDAQSTAKAIMSGLRMGQTLDVNKARAVVNDCVDSVLRNENALLLLSKIKNQDEYTAEHCINVSILAATFGKHLGLLEGEIRTLALCGLLHDVGKTRIPNEILNKPGALTPDEFAVMRDHTTHGRTILMGTSNSLSTAVDVAYSHHERMDGSGYPRGLQDHQIPYFAKIIGIVDCYDAITSTRCYDRSRASMQALEIIHKNRGVQFDEELAVEFVKLIGIYPPGSIVEMTNGEVGIVLESHARAKLKPTVLMVREANKEPRERYVTVNLMSSPTDTAGTPYKIGKEVPDGTYDIVLKDFVDQGLIGKASIPDLDEEPTEK